MLSELASAITIFEFISKVLRQTEPKSSNAIDTVLSNDNSNFDSERIIQELLTLNKKDTTILPENKVAEIVVYSDILKKFSNSVKNNSSKDLGEMLFELIWVVKNKLLHHNCFEDFDYNYGHRNTYEGYLCFNNLENVLFQNISLPMDRKSKYCLHLSTDQRSQFEFSNLKDVHKESKYSNNYRYFRVKFKSKFVSVKYNNYSVFSRRSLKVNESEHRIISINEFEIYFKAIMMDAIYYLNKSINENYSRLNILDKYK